MLQRFAQIVGALPELVEKPRILDCDHGLIGEGGRQLNLLVCEGANRATSQSEDANEIALAKQRDAKQRVIAAYFYRFTQLIIWIGLGIEKLCRRALERG